MDALFYLLFCPALLLFALVIGIVWLFMRGTAPHPRDPNASSGPTPRAPAVEAPLGELGQFAAFDRLVARWAADGRLDAATAGKVRDLIAEDWAAARGPVVAPEVAPTPPDVAPKQGEAPAPPIVAAERAAPPPASPASPATPSPAPATAAEAPPALAAAPDRPASTGRAPTPPRLARPSLVAALLSLGTRRTLLFLGTFLLLMSSLTLVVFSWASLPPLVQFAILAGTTSAIWAGGAWMTRKPDLATAGANLQAVAALLMPVVGFALGRPGLLDLAPCPAWQLASAVSLGAYLLAAWRTRRPFYSGAAALAAASLLLAVLGALAAAWQLVPLMALMAALLPIAGALRGSAAPRLGAGPRWVALLGGPATVLAAGWLYLGDGAAAPFGATLAAGALFCGLAYRLEGRAPWLWAAVALPPVALRLAMDAIGADVSLVALAFGGLGLAYLALSAWAEDRLAPATGPLFAGALAIGLYALATASFEAPAARLALPSLILLGAGVTALVERGRLRWLGPNGPACATGGLFVAGALGFWWLAALLEATSLSLGACGLVLLPAAAAFFAAARWWPGRLRRGYDLALQSLGTGATLLAWSATLLEVETRLAGALLVAAIFAGQAVLRRRWPWAAVSLGFAGLAAAFAVERFVAPAWQLRALTLAALALSAAYSLGGERVRRTGWRYWTWPGVVLGGLAGLLAAALALIQLPVEAGLFSGVLLALAALLGAHTALWRRAEPGYVAAPLLIAATLVAAGEGFFTGWRPTPGDLAYVVCALVLGLALLGRGLRRVGRSYARPYELAAFALLPAAPLFAGGDQAHLALTWAAMAGMYGAALWRYRLPWMLALAFVALDWALLHGSAWLLPGGEPAAAGLVLGVAVAVQALFSAWARRRPTPLGPAGLWGYLSAGIGAIGALLLASGSPGYAAATAGLLAATLAVLTAVERREELAWGALVLVALALSQLHRLLGLPAAWALLAGSFEALVIYAGGWGVQALANRLPPLSSWRRPLAVGAGGATIALPLALAGASIAEPAGLLGAALLLAGLGVALLGWRERQTALAGVAAGLWVLALAAEGPARDPIAWARVGSQLLLGLAWALGVAATARRLATVGLRGAPPAGPLQLSLYGAAGLGGLLALWVARSAEGPLGAVCLGLSALAALAATVERREAVAWGSLGLALGGAWLWHLDTGQAPVWTGAWMVLELVGVSLAGWAAALLGLDVWRRPTTLGTVGMGALLTAIVGGLALGLVLPALTFALASLGLLLATVAVRERELYYAYGAGAAIVGAALCQLADWGFSDPQWYVVPAGLYLLALAWGLRRFQGRRRASQLIEAAAVVMLLGITFGQAILGGLGNSLLLFGESLAIGIYGALARLRAPFLGGVAFFVAGVTWMTLDSVRLVNQWVLLGAVGLLMVLAYVVLERHQERLVRAGRSWMAQLQSWG